MEHYKTLKHKTLEGVYGCPAEFEGKWEIGHILRPEIYGAESSMEMFIEYWAKVPDSEILIEQLKEYDYIDIVVATPAEIEAISKTEENDEDGFTANGLSD